MSAVSRACPELPEGRDVRVLRDAARAGRVVRTDCAARLRAGGAAAERLRAAEVLEVVRAVREDDAREVDPRLAAVLPAFAGECFCVRGAAMAAQSVV